MPPSITIYTQPTCQDCIRLKRYLKQRGITYRDRDVTSDEEAFAEHQRFGVSTTPVIVIGDEIIVGFNQARLETLLSGVLTS